MPGILRPLLLLTFIMLGAGASRAQTPPGREFLPDPCRVATPDAQLEVARHFAGWETALGQRLTTRNLTNGARFLIDGTRQTFSVSIPAPVGTTAALADVRLRAWYAEPRLQSGLPAGDDVRVRELNVQGTLSRRDQLQQVIDFDVILPPVLSPWAQAMSLLVVGCVEGKAVLAGRFVGEVSSRGFSIGITVLAALLAYILCCVWCNPAKREVDNWLASPQNAALLANPQARKVADRLRRRSVYDPLILTQDACGFASLRRLQVLFFTFVVFVVLLYLVLRAGFLSDISGQLLLLLGIAAGGSLVAQLVELKPRPDGEEGPRPESLDALTRLGIIGVADRFGTWADLITENGELSTSKLQTLIFSGLVGVWIIQAGTENLSAFTLPENIVALIGLSQAVYVSGKASSKALDWKAVNDAALLLDDPSSTAAAKAEAAESLSRSIRLRLTRYVPARLAALRSEFPGTKADATPAQ